MKDVLVVVAGIAIYDLVVKGLISGFMVKK